MAAGAIAKALLRCVAGVEVLAFVSSVRDVTLDEGAVDLDAFTMDDVEANIVRCPHGPTAERMIAAIDEARRGRAPPGPAPCVPLASRPRRCRPTVRPVPGGLRPRCGRGGTLVVVW